MIDDAFLLFQRKSKITLLRTQWEREAPGMNNSGLTLSWSLWSSLQEVAFSSRKHLN